MTASPFHKRSRAAALVRAMIENGTLKPGQAAPSGEQLARLTGFGTDTCRRALRDLIKAGVLEPGGSPAARPLVAPAPGNAAARALSTALAARRKAHGLKQTELAAMTGYSATAIGHAETGRIRHSRAFWGKADALLDAGGELTALYDAWLAGHIPAHGTDPPPWPLPPWPPPPARARARVAVAVHVTVVWDDGSITRIPDEPAPGP